MLGFAFQSLSFIGFHVFGAMLSIFFILMLRRIILQLLFVLRSHCGGCDNVACFPVKFASAFSTNNVVSKRTCDLGILDMQLVFHA